jgi:DNA-directed RNA polymerase subunit RPC12/RpoP
MAETISVACNHCGAPLEVAAGTRFVTCNYCSSRLEVHGSDSATYTATLDAIEGHTAQMAEDLGVIRLQNEVEQLDRQWAIDREPLLVRDKSGNTSEPGQTAAAAGPVVGCLFVGFFAVVCIAMGTTAAGHGAPGLFALVPFGMAALAVIAFVVGMINQGQKASEFAEKRQAYERERQRLLAEIEKRR